MKGRFIDGEIVVTAEGDCAFCGAAAVDLVELDTQFDPQTAYAWTRFEVRPCRHVYTALHVAEFKPVVGELP